MRLFTSNTSKKFLPLVLASAVTAALTACGGGGGGSDSTAVETPAPQPVASKIEVPVDSVFAALLKGRVDHNAPEVQTANLDVDESQPTASVVEYFDAELVALNTETNEEFRFEWPMVVDESDMAASQKTVTLEPATYNFTLSVTKDSEQYIGMLAEYVISDTDEVRLPMELEPVIGETIVNIEAIMSPSHLNLEYPASELVSIEEPRIGIILDGEEYFFAVNKDTGIADVLLSIPDGEHSFDVKFYNGNIQIGRSEVGEQTLDLSAENAAFDIDIVSLQADVTVDDWELDRPFFTFNIPQEVIDEIGDISLVNLNVRLLDADGKSPDPELLPVLQREDGTYYAQHMFDHDLTAPVTAYLTFMDLTSGTPTEFSACEGTITISDTSTVGICEVGIPKPGLSFDGNLLATLSINVLKDENGDEEGGLEAQSGAEVFIDGVSAGITGSNFDTAGFLKKYEIAGPVRVSASKGELSASEDVVSTALGINNITLVLGADPLPPTGETCKSIKEAFPSAESGLYELDVDNQGGIEPFTTYCDMDTDGGGWTLVQNRQYNVPLETTYSLEDAAVSGELIQSDTSLAGAISNEAWVVLKETASELQVYSATGYTAEAIGRFYTTVDHLNGIDSSISCAPWSDAIDLLERHFLWYEADCSNSGADISGIGHSNLLYNSIIYNFLPDIWLEAAADQSGYPASTSIYVR